MYDADDVDFICRCEWIIFVLLCSSPCIPCY